MPMGKSRSPDQYPLGFHQVLAKGRGVWWLGLVAATEEAAQREMKRFMYFRRSLRENSWHRLARVEAEMQIGCKVKLNPNGPGYDVLVAIRTRRSKPLPRAIAVTPETTDREVFDGLQIFLFKDSTKTIDRCR